MDTGEREQGVELRASEVAILRVAVGRAAQRTFDIAFALTVLLLALPVLLVAAVAIKLDSPGPVLFRQSRMGLHGRPFRLVKLRGMYVDARARFPEFYDYTTFGDDQHFKSVGDPRVTRDGQSLRRFSIDELPNFWNVLRGDMTVVGPRPDIPEMAHVYGEHLSLFLSAKPGITSPAKACGRDRLTFRETLDLELEYLERRSFGLDLRIIARTAWSGVRGTDAS